LVVTRYREVERKFDVEPGVPLPDPSGADGALSEAVESQLDAIYFDTADAQLVRHRITLRRRTGGDDAGWHLKLPTGADERTEVRLPLGPATSTVPVALVREVRAIVRDRPLVPIATLHTMRTERRLLDAEGNALASVADDTVHGQRLTDGAVTVSTWREVEVELLDGDRSFLEAVSGRLRAAGLTPSESSSKLARVLGDMAQPKPVSPSAMSRAGRGTAGAVVLAYLQAQVDQLVMGDRATRAEEPDAVHKMGLATCRLRSALATYRPLLDRDRNDRVSAELKWLGQVLGRSREAEMLDRRMRDLWQTQPDELATGPVERRVDQELGDRRRAAHDDLAAALDGDRYFRLLDALDDLVANPPLTSRAGKPAHKQLPALVGRAARRVDRAARAVADDGTPHARDQGLGEVHKSAKRARFAAESAAPVVGKPARRLSVRMKSLQDALAEHRDSVAAQALLLELVVTAHLSGENGFTFGLLYARELTRADNARRAYRPALRKASTTRTRRWAR
jgi:CHAD domain-containing protein